MGGVRLIILILIVSAIGVYGAKKKHLIMICIFSSGLEVIKLEFILRLKIKRNDWLFADTCPQAANHCALF